MAMVPQGSLATLSALPHRKGPATAGPFYYSYAHPGSGINRSRDAMAARPCPGACAVGTDCDRYDRVRPNAAWNRAGDGRDREAGEP